MVNSLIIKFIFLKQLPMCSNSINLIGWLDKVKKKNTYLEHIKGYDTSVQNNNNSFKLFKNFK